MAEPDMRYNVDVLEHILRTAKLHGVKTLEGAQRYSEPDQRNYINLLHFLVRRDVQYIGHVYELPKVLPEHTKRVDFEVAHYMVRSAKERSDDAFSLVMEEVGEIHPTSEINDPIELYWRAQRFFELGSIGAVNLEYGHHKFLQLMNKAIKMKPDFGAAYLELARFHYTKGDAQKAHAISSMGIRKTLCNYPLLIEFEKMVAPPQLILFDAK